MHIAVIGAGVVGVTTAWVLRQRGHTVSVIDPQSSAGMETSKANAGQRSYGYVYPWASPAMIGKALPWLLSADGPLKMKQPPSLATLKFLWDTWRFARQPGLFEANKVAMLKLAAFSRECFIDLEQKHPFDFCGGHHGLMELASNAKSQQGLRENAALLQRLGIEHRMLEPDEVYSVEPGLARNPPILGALRVADDGTGDCLQFTRALAEVCAEQGVIFHYGQSVAGVTTRAGRPTALTLNRANEPGAMEQLEADAFVLCAGTGSAQIARQFGLKLSLYPVKGYSLTAALTNPDKAPQSTVIDDQFKVVATRLNDRLRVTGFVELADFNRDIPARRLQTLKRAIALRFPGAADLETADAWAGFRPMTPDGPPAIGKGPADNLFINTAHGTFGWTLSAGSAYIVGQLVDGEQPAVELDAFHPGRFG
ncbi:D-amino acid dehydrogenase [Saccharospirillum impatiens]|uniref:D-amino acid dehydrogenase n=1 Tax=Saccharospirillum impatiens TaxID=169438 RepID=UPI000409FD20|nr:D-amino acid dehydrogenase [Saccharospirillum impatiens]